MRQIGQQARSDAKWPKQPNSTIKDKRDQMNLDWTGILTVALAQIPTMAIVALGVMFNNSRISDLRAALIEVIQANNRAQFEALNRVEGVLDARLKHIEDR